MRATWWRRCTDMSRRHSRIWPISVTPGTMADVAHKAHRPAHSGAKADKKRKPGNKDKQAGTNEKVFNFSTVLRSRLNQGLYRPLHPSQADVPIDRVVVMQNVLRPDCMYRL